ncbi:hypothetical protein RCH06_000609 [Polaromonas sp. CG_9.5]|uniref:hypothetical protein n=1 Tax=Polaromonas sp. CG_9.5 TaxID=3071705 RepID=UPI002DF74AB1|nr:hypothetical protein [Polaromonas sp. CG_9.5]
MKKKAYFENFASRVSPRVRTWAGNGLLHFKVGDLVAEMAMLWPRHREVAGGGDSGWINHRGWIAALRLNWQAGAGKQ